MPAGFATGVLERRLLPHPIREFLDDVVFVHDPQPTDQCVGAKALAGLRRVTSVPKGRRVAGWVDRNGSD